jgi:F420H(2)-dependent quinone reductase
VTLQDGAIVYRLRAREVRGEEKARWWLIAERSWPRYAEFRAKAGEREIPVLVLEPRQMRANQSQLNAGR